MPNMASIASKKADEATAITYDSLNPSGGDGTKALWRQDTGAAAGLPVGHRATLTMTTSWNGPRTARRSVIEYKRPYSTLNTTTAKYETHDSVVARIEITVPQAIPASEINESVYQLFNCFGMSNGLIKQSVAAGFAPQ